MNERVTSESELVKESQKQDTSGVLNAVNPMLAGMLNLKIDPSKTFENIERPEVTEAIEKSSDIAKPISWKQKIANLKKSFITNVTYGSVGIDPKLFGDIRQAFRGVRISDRLASDNAEKIIALSYNKVGKEKYKLMTRAILYFDLLEDINNGRYKDGEAMMFNIKSPQEVIETAQIINEELKKPENKLVVEAMETRTRLMNEIRNKLVAEGKKAGQDLSMVFSKKEYMYHATLEYFQEQGEKKKASNKNGKIEIKSRIGSNKDFIADSSVADFIVLRSMYKQIAKIKLYNEIKKTDIKSTLPLDANDQPIIPDGYAELSPGELGVVTFTKYEKVKTIALTLKTMQMLNINRNSVDGRRMLKSALKDAKNNMIVIPSEIAEAVRKEFERPEHGVHKAMTKINNVWKYSKLRLPFTVWKYNARNMFGDLDVTFIGRPKALLKIPQALKELYGYYYQGKKVTADLQKHIEITGLSGGEYIQELSTVKKSKMFTFTEKDMSFKGRASDIAKKVWSKLTLETETEFREQILRYAAFLSFKEELVKSKDGLPKYYSASIPGEIQTISDIDVRASKLSNDLLGAYDDTSIAGKYAADHLIPFYRFKEVQIKRYYRIIKNSFYSDPTIVRTAGQNAVSKIGMAGRVGLSATLKIGKVAILASLFYAGLDMLNNIFAPDEEEKLPESVKSSPHLTVPSWAMGGENGRIYYLDRLGSFAELFNMFGIDYGMRKDMEDIFSGKMKYTDKIKEMALAPVFDTYNSSAPWFKMITELLTGKQFFPNPSSPTPIRDRWEYVAKQVGLVDEYKLATGKAMPNGNYFEQKRSMLFNSVQSDDTAYWDLMAIKDRFYKANGLGAISIEQKYPDSTDAKRSNAMYYYKQALKLNDKKAAEKYLKEYMALGGTSKTKDASFEAMDPLQGMTKKVKSEFLKWISPEEKKTYEQAMQYYKELIK
jgi:hypothetical protein